MFLTRYVAFEDARLSKFRIDLGDQSSFREDCGWFKSNYVKKQSHPRRNMKNI